jgi:hypothetical protein
LEGPRWGSLRILDGSARPRLAGAGAPSAARGGALPVLETAWQRDGGPVPVIADRGGAGLSDAFAGGCPRLEMAPQPLVSPQGQSAMPLLATPWHMQRRREDSQRAWPRTPCECAAAPQRCRALDHLTAPQGLLQERLAAPSPRPVLGKSTGRLSPPQALARQCAPALCVRTPHASGGVTLPRSPFDVDPGRAQTPVWLGGAGADRRAV